MPKIKLVTEYDFHEFEELVVETFGLMPDYSVVASEKWNNDTDHLFVIQPVSELMAFEREELDEIYEAAAEYRIVAEANGGDTQGYGLPPKPQALKDARKRLHEALEYRTALLFIGLVEQGKIQPGEYNISVCW